MPQDVLEQVHYLYEYIYIYSIAIPPIPSGRQTLLHANAKKQKAVSEKNTETVRLNSHQIQSLLKKPLGTWLLLTRLLVINLRIWGLVENRGILVNTQRPINYLRE